MAEKDKPKVMATAGQGDQLARARAAALAKSGPGMTPEQISQFFKDTWSELKKTTWPDKPTLTKSTVIVLAFIFATMVWVGFFDFILTHITAPLFGK